MARGISLVQAHELRVRAHNRIIHQISNLDQKMTGRFFAFSRVKKISKIYYFKIKK